MIRDFFSIMPLWLQCGERLEGAGMPVGKSAVQARDDEPAGWDGAEEKGAGSTYVGNTVIRLHDGLAMGV